MKKELLNLQRDIIEGGKGCQYDHYAYNSFAWRAQDLSYRAENDEERELCLFLKGMASKKAEALKQQKEQQQASA